MAAVDLANVFGFKWAENGTVDVIDDSQWTAGWAFIGATPPSVEQFNKVFQIFDEKTNYINSRRIGGMAGFSELIGASGALDSSHLNRQLAIEGVSGSGTWSLPPTAGMLDGATLNIYARAGSRITITSPSSNIFGTGVPGGGVASLVLASQSNQTLVWTGTYWLTTNNSAAGNLEPSGVKAFGDGFMMQWLSVSGLTPGVSQLVALPTAFPTAKLWAVACPGSSGVNNNSQVGVSIAGGTLGQINVCPGAAGVTGYILAFGK